jgi:hypothetical protein
MTRRPTAIDERLHDYLLANSLREPEVLRRLREETAKLPGAGMQIGPEQGQFMALLVELIGARRTLEIGTSYQRSLILTPFMGPIGPTLRAGRFLPPAASRVA